MNPLKTIVIEDERLPRLALLQKLEDFRQQVEVVQSCDNYDDALQAILHHQPDLIMMDIQLQGRDAMQLLNELQQTTVLPKVIFTTAYADRRYLMSAIKFQALDYLMKPIDKNELAIAIAKAVSLNTEQQAETWNSGKLALRTASGKVFINPADIAYVCADGNYSLIGTFQGLEHVLESLAALEQMLDQKVFFRIDRSTIVNVMNVYKVNVKRRICILHSEDGAEVELELSKMGTDRLLRMM